jgi:hypothetical protein
MIINMKTHNWSTLTGNETRGYTSINKTIYTTPSSPKAQGSLQKRDWKDYKSEAVADYKIVFSSYSKVITHTRGLTGAVPAWMRERVTKPQP